MINFSNRWRTTVLLLGILAFGSSLAEPLIDAAKLGNLEEVKSLYAQRADLNSKNDFEMTALHFAANKGHVEIVKFLLDKGAQVDPQNKNGYTPLMLASDAGHKDIVNALLDKGAQIDPQVNNSYSPLTLAIEAGHKDLAHLLVTRGANFKYTEWIEKRDVNGQPTICIHRRIPLGKAMGPYASKEDVETVKWLVSLGADVNTEYSPEGVRCGGMGETIFHTVLRRAIVSKNYEMLKFFLEHGADVNKKAQELDGDAWRRSNFRITRWYWVSPLEMSEKNKEVSDLLRSYGAE